MHEGAVCTEIMEIVTNAAKTNGMSNVSEILLTVGPYSCLNLGQLNFYFDVAKENTCMAGAVIHMETDATLTGTSQMYISSIRGE